MQTKSVEDFGDSKSRVQRGAKPYLDIPRYDMSKNKYHLIFNNRCFYKFEVRESSDKDASRLQDLFASLDFKVFQYNDYTKEEIFAVLEKLCKEDHRNTSCIVITFLTHGDNGGLLWARDRPYFLNDVVKVFETSHHTLSDKPKLFFVQACRGQKLDSGKEIGRDNSQDSESSHASNDTDNCEKYISTDDFISEKYRNDVRIHRPHFLIAYATCDGFYAFRTKDGSWFIQELCNGLENHCNMDINRILMVVMRNVAYNRISHFPDNKMYDLKKQMPETLHTLTKQLIMKN